MTRLLRSRRQALSAIAASVLLGGCASLQPEGDRDASPSGHWSGRLSLNVDSHPPEQFHASFDLAGSETAGQLLLSSPLGTTIALLQWRPGEAKLQQGGRSRDYASVDELAAAVSGTPIPVRSLFAWLHGVNEAVAGWTANLDQLAQGRLSARREHPAPAARLRIILQDAP